MAYGDTELAVAVDAVAELVDLQRNGSVEIGPNILPELLPEIPSELEHSCQALVCRPTWGGKVTEELVARLRVPGKPFAVATLSSGSSNVLVEKNEDTEIFAADEGNAEQTAELTIFLAICLLRRALVQMVNMGFGVYRRPQFEGARSLHDLTTWVIAGPGAVGEAVLKKAAAMGVANLRAYHSRFAGMEQGEIAAESCRYKRLDERGVMLTGDLDRALKGADVVSLHMPCNDDTVGSVDKSWFEWLPDNAVLVNCARHEVVNEEDLIAALRGNSLQGYAADVLPPRSERLGANPLLPDVELWRRACWSLISSIDRCTEGSCAFQDVALAEKFLLGKHTDEQDHDGNVLGERNMVYTPHIGGSTRDAEDNVANEVVNQLRHWLEVTR